MPDGVNIKFVKGGSKLFGMPRKGKKIIRGMGDIVSLELSEVFLNEIRKRLKEDGLHLERLSRNSIARKRAKGFPRPSVPMYGKGEGDTRSYWKLLRVRKNPKSVSVGFQGNTKHHSGFKIKDLAIMHAEGGGGFPKRNPIGSAFRKFNIKKAVRRVFLKKAIKLLREIFR